MKDQNNDVQIKRTTMLQFINTIGGGLKKNKLNPFPLQADAIIKKAKKQADFKGELPPQVETGLHKLVKSIQNEAKTNAFADLALKGLLERTLYGRLRIEQSIQQQPEILQKTIKQPIFIIGMPRTGTTILHALMHQDPQHRSPLAWECLLPHPVPTDKNYQDNPQLQQVQKEFGQLFQLVPDFKKKHYMEADSPQECLGINALDFNSFQTIAQVYIPSYLEWFSNESDQLSTMKFHKKFLQYLESGGQTAARWLLKSPVHLFRLKEIFEVYPDACIIMTHRHPSRVVPSAASLVGSVRSLYSDHEDLARTGREQAAIWSSYFDRFLSARQELNREAQIIDVKFEDFVQDQMTIIRQIYTHFGWELSEDATTNMQQFLVNNPKDKHGKHDYALADFDLTEADIETQFCNYIHFLNQL